jgi:ABC-type nitrate/sulfonate/bicarbonate transport system permease component
MNLPVHFHAVAHIMYARLRSATRADQRADEGAVSLEQVLWFVAAGVAVAVVAGILWGRIRTEANAPINRPTAP